MNYSGKFQNKIFTKFTGISLFFLALFLGSLALFFSQKSSSEVYERDCSSIGEEIARPGNNCLILNKKLCQGINNVSYVINPSAISSDAIKIHRKNCADLSDLPLCSQIDTNRNVIDPGKNCVRECSDPLNSGTGVRGEDFAVHNRDCVRFCDAIENGVSTNISLSQKCITRRCHQVPNGVTPTSPACEFMDCDLLTSDELNEPRLTRTTNPIKYCNGGQRTLANGTREPIKCFDFKQDTFDYIRFRGNSHPATQCQIHNCRTTSQTCSSYSSDDVSKILAKDAQYPGFSTAYQNKFNNGNPITEPGAYCTAVVCKPVVKRFYLCTLESGAEADSIPTKKHNECDSECSSGACYKNIDCNLTINASQEECTASRVNSDGSIGTDEDPVNSWFYRPKPMNKAFRNVGTVYEEMDRNSLCYHTSNMENNGFGYSDIFGLYYHNYLAYDTRSPPLCSTGSDGNGGYGYGYLCGVNGDFYSEPGDNDDTAYIRGYVKTNFSEGEALHRIEVCLRFNNNMIPWKTCGRRECGITCYGAFGCESQVCGVDSCYYLYIKDSEAQKCMMNNDTFSKGGDSDSYDCLRVVDGNIRIRAVKYDNRICAFLDTSGTTAWAPNDDYLTGDEKLSDGTCYSGHADANGNCIDSKGGNSERGRADRWRAIDMIKYIENNQGSGRPQGYLDVNGRLYPKQECIKTSLRSPPPKFWNLSNAANANKLFVPPLRIDNVYLKKGGSFSSNKKTDFHYPAIDVLFGTELQTLSLDAGKTGYETNDRDENAAKTITSIFFGFSYSVEVFVRKEYNASSNKPLFCLYQKVRKTDGTELDPIQIDCVERNLPEINNAELRALDSTIDSRRITISADPTNTFRSSKIIITYTAGLINPETGAQNLPRISIPSFGNADRLQESCSFDVEKYTICIQRDYCSAIESECAANEVDLHNANFNEDIAKFTAIRNNCDTTITNTCNTLKGLDANGNVILNNAYGWFNELCITRGFETKLRTIRAYKLQGILGKCIIDTVKSKAALDLNANACNDGGNAALGCYCAGYNNEVTLPDGEIARKETPHEAGLCINLPLAQRCPAIDYNTTPNSVTPSDPEYVLNSLGKSLNGNFTTTLAADYNSTTPVGGVHLSHRARSLGNPFSFGPNASLISHAEFPRAIAGMANITGTCNGFWKQTTSDSGEKLTPTMDCIPQASGSLAVWSSVVNNDCSRSTCPRIFTNPNGIEDNGLYQNSYGILENGEDKGLSHGFATWPSHTQISDFAENQNAEDCIPGFKRNGASTTVNTSPEGISSLVSGSLSSNVTIASLYNRITGFSGGTPPSRKCNQDGFWAAFDTNNPNICKRVTCPEINDTVIKTLSDSGSNRYWELWRNTGGASFPRTNASRSKTRNNSAEGVCNTSLGFHQIGSIPPKRECDYLGNWGDLTLPCTTECDAITDATPTDVATASSDLHGFSYWKARPNEILSESLGEIDADKGNRGCVTGYIPYPYPPLKTNKGEVLTLSDSGPYRSDTGSSANLMTIPRDVKLDPREPRNPNTTSRYPERTCVPMTSTNNDITIRSNVWSPTSSRCINKCPGSEQDPRINVGKTAHTLSDGSVVEVLWGEEVLGNYQTRTNCDDGTGLQFSAATFTENRTNGCYLLRRKCNANGKWSDPEPMCVATNGGQIGNAIYSVTNPSTSSRLNNAAVVGSATRATGTCINNYWTSNRGQRSRPQRTCSYGKNADGSSNTFIDKVYWRMTGSSRDCEQITCLAPKDQIIYDDTNTSTSTANTRASISITSTWVGGTVRELSCSPNGDINFIANPWTFNRAVVPIYTSTVGGAPTITCRNTGTTAEIGTWGPVQNRELCQRMCLITGFNQGRVDLNNSGGGDGIWFSGPKFENGASAGSYALHNTEFNYNFSDSSGGDCDKYSRSFRCNDGNWEDSIATTGDDVTCSTLHVYNWTTRSWGEIRNSAIAVGNGMSCHVRLNGEVITSISSVNWDKTLDCPFRGEGSTPVQSSLRMISKKR
jgi:hypothetical protein